MKRIYFDLCCLNRPFDDQSQARVRMESEAVLLLLRGVQDKTFEMVSSEAIEEESSQNPDDERRLKVRDILSLASRRVRVGREEATRATELAAAGMGAYDALHVACAESAKADVLLSTDDDLLKKASAVSSLAVRVCNPVSWLSEVS